MLRYRLYRLAGFVGLHSPHRFAYSMAALTGYLSYLFNRSARAVALANMRQVLGPEATVVEVRRAARGCFRAAAFYYADLSRTPKLRPGQFLTQNVKVTGFEHLTNAAAAGHGVIAATIHYGNPEFTAQSLAGAGIHFVALVEPLEPPALSELFRRFRSSHGHEFVDVGVSGVKRAIRHLRSGGIIAVLIDRDIQHTGLAVSFFGAPARMPAGAVDLALHTGAAIVPFVTRRIALDTFEAVIEAPLELVRTADPDADRRVNTERLIQRFEPYLREDPSQWFVLEECIWPALSGALSASADADRAPVPGRRSRTKV